MQAKCTQVSCNLSFLRQGLRVDLKWGFLWWLLEHKEDLQC